MSSPPYSTAPFPPYLDFCQFGKSCSANEAQRVSLQAEADRVRQAVLRETRRLSLEGVASKSSRRECSFSTRADARPDYGSREYSGSSCCSCTTTSTRDSGQSCSTCTPTARSTVVDLGGTPRSITASFSCSTCRTPSCFHSPPRPPQGRVRPAPVPDTAARSHVYSPPSYHTFAKPISVRSSDVTATNVQLDTAHQVPPVSNGGTSLVEPTRGMSPCHSITQSPSSRTASTHASLYPHPPRSPSRRGQHTPQSQADHAATLRARLHLLKLEAKAVQEARERVKDAIATCKQMHEQYTAKKKELKGAVERMEKGAQRRRELREADKRRAEAEGDWKREEEAKQRAVMMARGKMAREGERKE